MVLSLLIPVMFTGSMGINDIVKAQSTWFIFLTPLAAFVFFMYKGLDVARRSKDVYANLLAVGVTSMIGIQALINVAVVSSSIPATGVPLPFISYGGSSLIMNLLLLGIAESMMVRRY